MPFIPASSFQWEMQPDNRRCWADVWGRRLSRQERGCLHFFRNSFHSPLSRTLDDINIMCLWKYSCHKVCFQSQSPIKLYVSGMWTASPQSCFCGVFSFSWLLSQTWLCLGFFLPTCNSFGLEKTVSSPCLGSGCLGSILKYSWKCSYPAQVVIAPTRPIRERPIREH